MANRLAIYHPQGQIAFGDKPFGKDVANRDLFAALALHGGYEQLDILTHGNIDAEALAEQLLQGRPAATRVAAGHILSQKTVIEAGVLLRGKADLASVAWLRRRVAGDRAYSLAGVVHTIAPLVVRDYIAAAAVAPVQPWDALICTSPSVQDALDRMFDEWCDFLADRFGGDRRPKPRLPLVPLGVDLQQIAAAADDPAARAAVRAEFGLSDQDIMVLWVGRLSFFEKAFPQPMLRAVEEAAAATGARVHFVHAGWFPGGEQDQRRYEAAAQAYAPNVTVRFVSGDDRARIGRLWAGADLFISLVDNIQETFGITPVEAMAAALPVVVSDWDGYRYTVQDGVQGFLIPTLGGPAGRLGYSMSTRHTLLMDSYQAYAGLVAQHTAVHVGRAAEAIAALIRSPDLRRTMGAAGRARVAATFDWPVVVGELKAVFDELAQIRASAPGAGGPGWPLNPVRGDPFRDFAGFATGVLNGATPLSLRSGAGPADLERARGLALDQFGGNWRSTPAECALVVELLASGERWTVDALAARFPPDRRWPLELTLMWMMKLGVVDWLEPSDPD
ncbi:MAG TPA: glycosyltransferase family 4 protein [Caulobacteraceae bacterium]|jgi:glycosyltransferase involved in cell wall biosynthesis|nr:glycosyltransferase family 4 protein [Caulobacteraceae bacterium]